MPLETILDTVQDAEVQQSLHQGSRFIRTGIVKGLTLADTTSKLALLAALDDAPDMPDIGEQLDDEYPEFFLMFRTARGIDGTKGTMARVWLHYETLRGGGIPVERFTVRDTGYLIAEPTNVFPGTAKQLLCSTTSSSPDYDGTQRATDRPITANWPRNQRVLQLVGLFADRPPLALLNAGNTVNHAEWQSRPRGYWRMDPPDVQWSDATGMYRVGVDVMSKGIRPGEDWSTYEIPIDPNTGHQVKVADSVLAALYAQTYELGVRNDKNGVWKGGFYPVSNLSSLLGDELGN